MPYYLFQGRFTAEAIRAMVNNPQDREQIVGPMIESMGAKMHKLFFAFGQEDVVALLEAPDDATAASVAMVVAAGGAMSAGATTKLMTSAEAMEVMRKAQAGIGSYKPPA